LAAASASVVRREIAPRSDCATLAQPDRAEAWCRFLSSRTRTSWGDRGCRHQPTPRRIPPAGDQRCILRTRAGDAGLHLTIRVDRLRARRRHLRLGLTKILHCIKRLAVQVARLDHIGIN
jgi:hypothetical protein